MPNTLFLGESEFSRANPEVIADAELAARPWRAPDYGAECAAYVALVRMFTSSPVGLLQEVADTALALCQAQSAGISLLEVDQGHPVFRWYAASGAFAPNVWRTIARAESPCDAVLTQDRPLLMIRPELRYAALKALQPGIVELLMVPFRVHDETVGTLWVLSQREQLRFDSEHVRLLTRLAEFAAVGYEMQLVVRLNRQA
jgi:GAF domain-containing protein